MNVISPDLSVLEALVVFDISNAAPVINITNQSTGPHLNNITWWFIVNSPSGTPIHAGSFSTPDETGIWTSLVLTDMWPTPFSQIEWSGAPYTLDLYAQDSVGNVFILNKSASICRPTGNVQNSQNTYGIANVDVKVLCEQARIFFQDQTSVSYKGSSGVKTSSILKVVYPMDPTYTIPAPFQISSFSTAMVPISYSSDNYQFLAASTYSYDQGNNVSIVIKYQTIQTFSVLCNIDLMPLICEYQKLIDSVENGSCTDVQDANKKMMLINPKLSLVVMGILQPLTGVDVTGLIEEIQEIGGFTCNCCTAATGVIPQNASVIDGYSFSINPVCGDISGSVTQVGSNIQINLSDKTYVFAMGVVTGTTAFSVTPATNGCLKTYSLNVSMIQLATDILTVISTNAGLVNLFNSIVPNSGGLNLIVDGKCIFNSTASFNYAFTLANVPVNTTFALITGIQAGSVSRALNFSLNLTNLVAFQSYLNSLGIGTFVVTNPSGQNVLISSTANPNVLSNLTYSISAVSFIAALTSSETGYVAISANQVVQNIINYLCALTDSQVTTSMDYVVNYISPDGPAATTIPAGTSISSFIQQLLTFQEETLTNGGNGSVTCDGLKAIFPANNQSITSKDYIYATKNGSCSQVGYADAFLYMISNMSNAAKVAFCDAVTACGAGLSCDPYTFFTVQVDTFNTSCTPIVGINFTLS
jgi:hypothetical protein